MLIAKSLDRIGNEHLESLSCSLSLENFKLQLVDIEPVLGCNLRCRMCHVSFMKEKVNYLDIENINFDFCRDKVVTIGGVFEPFIHPKINLLIEKLNSVNAQIILVTNAHNFNKKEVPAIFESNLQMVTFSFDGISQRSYEEVRRGGNYYRTIENIKEFISNYKNSNTKFSINYTVLKSNVMELEAAPAFWNEIGVDLLRFIGMVVRENDDYLLENNLWTIHEEYCQSLRKAIDTVKNKNLNISISNPKFREWMPEQCPNGVFSNGVGLDAQFISHHHKYGLGEGSPIGNGCISPFSTARIDWNGDVFLCHNQKIGNLLVDSFESIWSSVSANGLRGRLIKTQDLCENCEYYKLCINSNHFDTNNVGNYFNQDFKDRFPSVWEEIKNSSNNA